MKVAFIFGKGIEGCGVTKGANIFEDWLVSQGHETMVIDFDNQQKFGRAKDTDWKGTVLRVESNHTIDDAKPVLDQVNTCDIAIVHSYPTRKNGKYIDRFREFVEGIKDPIIVVHDHAITKNTINRQTQAAELFSLADIGVTQSFEGYSNECYLATDPGLEGRLMENPIWVRTGEYDKYRVDLSERSKHFMYMGRMSTLKDPGMICRIEPYLKGEWDLTLMGCERSISSIGDPDSKTLATDPAPYHKSYQPKIKFVGTNSEGEHYLPAKEKEKTDTTITAYDSYKYDFGMGELGKSMAAWCGYRLGDPKEYGHRMEYTVIESFLLSLPVISRHFAENAVSPEGKKWGEYYGPLVSEATKEEELAAELKRIANDPDEWEKRTQACRELVYKFNDIEVLGPKFLDFVLTKGKRNDKIDFIDRISSYFPSARDRRDRGEIIVSTPGSVLNEKAYTLVDGRQNEIKEPKQVGATLEGFF
jgi:glycosyltransferase involved in cell wall biosynthesis